MRFKIKDNRGDTYEVKEIPAVKEFSNSVAKNSAPVRDEKEELTAAELKTLKKLLAKATELLALLKVEEKEHETEEFADDELEIASEKDEKEELKEEEIEDSEELDDTMINDSKKSFGSIEPKKIIDSNELDEDAEIAQAWANRYGGKK